MTIRDLDSADAEFGAAVARHRGFRKMSQKDLASALSDRGMRVDASAVSRIENGARSVRLVEALTIADALNVDLDLLVGDVLTPAQELSRMVRRADETTGPLSEPLRAFLSTHLWTQMHLEANPELVTDLTDIAGPEDYFRHAAARIRRVFTPPDPNAPNVSEVDYVFYLSNEQHDGLLEVLTAYAESLLVDYRERNHGAATNSDR